MISISVPSLCDVDYITKLFTVRLCYNNFSLQDDHFLFLAIIEINSTSFAIFHLIKVDTLFKVTTFCSS